MKRYAIVIVSLLWLCVIVLGQRGRYDYSGAVNIRIIQLKPDLITPPHSEGCLFYDPVENTIAYYNDEPDVTHNIGQEMWIFVRNDTGSTIDDGKVVYISGVIGKRPTIALAKADDISTSNVIGFTTHSIEDNTNGYVTTKGIIHNQNTTGLTAGDVLYLSEITAGEVTITIPTAPNLTVKLGIVTVINPSIGEILAL